MEIEEDQQASQNGFYDPLDHKACYVFTPDSTSDPANLRPTKRRRLSKKSEGKNEGDSLPQTSFRPLLDGNENANNVKLRYQTYQRTWEEQKQRIESILHAVNAKTLHDVGSFVRDASSEEYQDRIPTGLIVAGPSIASHGLLFEQLEARIKSETRSPMVILTSNDASNLKSMLKKLIRIATNEESGIDEDETGSARQKGPRLLNYDLQLLANYVKEKGCSKVTIAFQDSDAFDGNLMTDLIELFNSWLDRIPFVLLFGIATSAEIFHEKLPRAAIRCMRGQKFDVERIEQSLELVFNEATSDDSAILLGPNLASMLLDRQRNHVQSVQSFVSSLQYGWMSHFYANALSIFLAPDLQFEQLQPEHFEALRNLTSFRRHVEKLLEDGDTQTVRDLLDDNKALFSHTIEHLHKGRQELSHLLQAVRLLEVILKTIHENRPTISSSSISRPELYIQAIAGELDQGSATLREVLLSIKKASSDVLRSILDRIISILPNLPSDSSSQSSSPASQDPSNSQPSPSTTTTPTNLRTTLHAIQADLLALLSSDDADTPGPLLSEHDIHHTTLRTTIIAQKVSLSKQKSNLSARDAAYSRLLHRAHDALSSYFSSTISSIHLRRDIFGSEILIHDLRLPLRDVVAPKTRFAIERALARPHDYLACSCCVGAGMGGTTGKEGAGGGAGALSATQPPTAILYQLYLESGALINVSDLWSAFFAIMGPDTDDNGTNGAAADDGTGIDGEGLDDAAAAAHAERRTLALFYRSLAELKWMGLVKQSRKKTDHLAKLQWRGL
ncbi:hypothetical protein L228DRAFT_279249 [Xylona heveae TC161]|uniref:Uncharacterized protein n=1 Tax=Xylona heveae (strain CBS 132557 / TC161) TaxID=1328760 RepID=A0A165JAY6_XYLHT|nr:hypothetical protein L228DRAFT_279249 [Xylona heveae TC161]KZF25991.1 hypothetical protein L228DRAFT_279249 [Xylona heveae TC161]